ncbi:hypothetical protein GM658_19690 [Pseudoduganella eburnea]|uniref:Uncharacterized protein n=1 Tax=Massilia eburnea TaxID=1776165 RepID=A0A6L6QL63_9BURK|nr:hypothetical protein [Massilia eburnea]MTW12834.1 hypothetical protein [Massilia eburnea]
MRDQQPKNTGVIQVDVVVQQDGTTFKATYSQGVIPVSEHDTKIEFHLVAPTPDDIIIDQVTIKQLGQTQLSTPEIKDNGKKAKLTDKNTERASYNLKFTFKNKHTAASALRADVECKVEGLEIPQIDNNPPG